MDLCPLKREMPVLSVFDTTLQSCLQGELEIVDIPVLDTALASAGGSHMRTHMYDMGDMRLAAPALDGVPRQSRGKRFSTVPVALLRGL